MHKNLLSTALTVALFGASAAQAALIDFNNAGALFGTYFQAGARRDLSLLADDGVSVVSISGGTPLVNETFLPANHTALYGTAFFGTTTATVLNPQAPVSQQGGAYLPTVTIDLPVNAQSFYMDVYNGQVFNVTYTLADNAGHSKSFLLVPNLASGTTQIGFNPSGNQITLTSDAGSLWDFSIDNIFFSTDPTAAPPPTATTPVPTPYAPPPPPVVVSVDTPPPPPLLTEQQRIDEGLLEQQDRHRQKGKNKNDPPPRIDIDFRLEAQGLHDQAVAPVPLPMSLPLMASALIGVVALRRRAR